MALTFEKGDPSEPRGHALVYFRHASSGKLLATYVVVLPIAMNITKYLPPFLAPHVGGMAGQDLAAFALPPVPEEAPGLEELQRLADMRDDDLIASELGASDDLPAQMEALNEVVQQYAELWTTFLQRAPAGQPPPQEQERGVVGVNEVLYGLMSEHDKLAEASKLVGKLRFAVEGNDAAGIREAEEELGVLTRHVPSSYDVPSLVRWARDPSRKGGELAKLYLERCYRLCDGDAQAARELDARIASIQSSP